MVISAAWAVVPTLLPRRRPKRSFVKRVVGLAGTGTPASPLVVLQGGMDPLSPRIVARFAGAVVPFKPKPGVPTVVIGGQKYVLSTDGGPLGDREDDEALAAESPFGGRLIMPAPGANKWRYLWVYDTDKKYVVMWRASDGNEKAAGSDKHFLSEILKLDKKGQLNRVTHREFQVIEREMTRRADAELEALKETVEEMKSDYQREIDRLAGVYYKTLVVPKIEQAIRDVRQGAIPLGFEFNSRIPRSEEHQKTTFVIARILTREVTEDKLDEYIQKQGIDTQAPNVDLQAVYWAAGDLRERAYEEFLPPR